MRTRRTFKSSEMKRSFMGPACRFKEADRIAREGGPYAGRGVDGLTRQTARYLDVFRSGDGGPDRALKKYPEISAAFCAWNETSTADQLRILAIANCPREEIAARLQIDEPIVAIIEQLFFDVRWVLDASDWIVCRAIIPEIRAGAFDLAAKLKLAFFGGPVMARAILDARIRLPFEESKRLFDREILLHVKMQEALEAPLEETERIELVKLYLQYDINRRRLDLDKKKFAYECEQAEYQERPEDQPHNSAAQKPEEEDFRAGPDWEWGEDGPAVTKDLLDRLVA